MTRWKDVSHFSKETLNQNPNPEPIAWELEVGVFVLVVERLPGKEGWWWYQRKDWGEARHLGAKDIATAKKEAIFWYRDFLWSRSQALTDAIEIVATMKDNP